MRLLSETRRRPSERRRPRRRRGARRRRGRRRSNSIATNNALHAFAEHQSVRQSVGRAGGSHRNRRGPDTHPRSPTHARVSQPVLASANSERADPTHGRRAASNRRSRHLRHDRPLRAPQPLRPSREGGAPLLRRLVQDLRRRDRRTRRRLDRHAVRDFHLSRFRRPAPPRSADPDRHRRLGGGGGTREEGRPFLRVLGADVDCARIRRDDRRLPGLAAALVRRGLRHPDVDDGRYRPRRCHQRQSRRLRSLRLGARDPRRLADHPHQAIADGQGRPSAVHRRIQRERPHPAEGAAGGVPRGRRRWTTRSASNSRSRSASPTTGR